MNWDADEPVELLEASSSEKEDMEPRSSSSSMISWLLQGMKDASLPNNMITFFTLPLPKPSVQLSA